MRNLGRYHKLKERDAHRNRPTGHTILYLRTHHKLSLSAARQLPFRYRFRDFFSRYSIFQIVSGLGAGLIIPIFSLWFFVKFHYDETVLAPLNTVAAVFTALAGLLAPRLADWLGDIPSVMLENGVATVLLVTMPSTKSFLVLSALFVFRQFLMNMSTPIMSSIYMSHVDPSERASAAAIAGTYSSLAWSFPNSITPAVGGYLMQNVSVDLPLYLCGTSYIFGVLLIYLFFYKQRNKSDKGCTGNIASKQDCQGCC